MLHSSGKHRPHHATRAPPDVARQVALAVRIYHGQQHHEERTMYGHITRGNGAGRALPTEPNPSTQIARAVPRPRRLPSELDAPYSQHWAGCAPGHPGLGPHSSRIKLHTYTNTPRISSQRMGPRAWRPATTMGASMPSTSLRRHAAFPRVKSGHLASPGRGRAGAREHHRWGDPPRAPPQPKAALETDRGTPRWRRVLWRIPEMPRAV